MRFQIQKVSNHGANVPVVARTLLQAHDLMQAFGVPEALRLDVADAMVELQRKLLHCFDIYDKVRQEVETGRLDLEQNGLRLQAGGQVAEVPSVIDVENRAESFLQSAKLAIGCAGRILDPFFGTKFDHRFDKIVKWARNEFPHDHLVVRTATACESSMKEIVTMRNAVDHPSDQPRGRLVITNFHLITEAEKVVLHDPCWALTGDDPALLVRDMKQAIENILGVGEDLLSVCLLHTRKHPLVICEIPENDRNPECPVRLYAALAPDPGA
jgi:hypothetical protein